MRETERLDKRMRLRGKQEIDYREERQDEETEMMKQG